MTELIAEHIQQIASHAAVWGFVLIFVLMTVESSFIPFPSEVVMIPAGVLAYRGELTFGLFYPDAIVAIILAIAGSLLGAWINYWLSDYLGRPILYRYGKYFFLKPEALERAENIFREYGDIATFVCRLLPAIRQLISIPAGLSRMNPKRFTFFTGLGAGIWSIILFVIGVYLGHLSDGKSYLQIVTDGKIIIQDNMLLLLGILTVLCIVYLYIHKKIMHHTPKEALSPSQHEKQ